MKKTIMILALMAGTQILNAQSSIGIKYGAAMPVGEFKDDGWADNGFSFEINGNFSLNMSEGFAITALFRLQGNSIDESTFRDEVLTDPSLSYRYKVEGWVTTNLFTGLSSKTPLDDNGKLFWTGRLTGGLITASSPETDIRIENPNNGASAVVNMASKDGSGIGYLVGTGLTYNANELIDITLNVDFTGGNIEFKDVVTTTDYSDGTRDRTTSTEDQSFSSTLISLGVDFKF